MRTTEARCDAVRRRAREMARSRRNRRTVALSAALCLMLVAALALALPRLTAGFSGAALLAEGAGGYVLVGVAAFMLAVALTLLCTRLREREKRSGSDDRENHDL